jgi:hypothetical protein
MKRKSVLAAATFSLASNIAVDSPNLDDSQYPNLLINRRTVNSQILGGHTHRSQHHHAIANIFTPRRQSCQAGGALSKTQRRLRVISIGRNSKAGISPV